MQSTNIHHVETRSESRTKQQDSRLLGAGMVLKRSCFLAALVAITAGSPLRSLADLPYVYSVENQGTNCTAPPLPSLPPPSTFTYFHPLPDPFCCANDPINLGGTRSTNFTDWECRRNEIKAQLETYEIGPKPAVNVATQVTASYSGGTTPGTTGTMIVRVTVGTNTLSLTN